MANPIILADNRFLNGTPTATDTAANYNVLNVRDGKTFTSWKAASSGTKYITVDCGTAMSADSLGIAAHNLFTADADVSVESSANGTDWTERLAAFTPTSDRALLKTFNSASARYWRLKIVTASVASQIAIAMIGARIDFPYPPDAPFAPVRMSVEGEISTSKAGVMLGYLVRYKPVSIKARFTNIGRTFVDNTFYPFWRDWASELFPFFWVWDITPYPFDVRFVRLSEKSSYEAQVSVLSVYDSIELDMEGVAD